MTPKQKSIRLHRNPSRSRAKFTPLEMKALAIAYKSARGNGHDFGFTEDIVKGMRPLKAQATGALITSLEQKGVITVNDPVTTDSGTWTQFTWNVPPETVADLIGVMKKNPAGFTLTGVENARRNPDPEEQLGAYVGNLQTDSPTYKERVKVRGWNVKVSPLMDADVGGRLLRQRLPHFSKADHKAAAHFHAKQRKHFLAEWNDLVEREHRRVFKRPFEATDYKIAGIAREEYSESVKDQLRELASAASDAGAAAAAHWKAAGKRSRMALRDDAPVDRANAPMRRNPAETKAQRQALRELNAERAREDSKYGGRRKPLKKLPPYLAKPGAAEAWLSMRRNPAGFTQGPRPRKLARSRMAREIIVLSGKRSGHVFAYATPETSKAELVAEASRIARARGEPIKVQRVSAATLARIAPKIPGVVQRYVSNPAPRSDAVERAARRFSRFTGHRAEHVEMVPFPAKPKAGLAVGPVLVLAYRATRDGKTENYMHKFAPHARPMLVASDDGKTLHLVGGRYSFTERGIVDAKK